MPNIFGKLKEAITHTHLLDWYGRYEQPISSLSLIGGFVFDALTLKRVDMFWENFWVVAHLLIVATCIILINNSESNDGDAANPDKMHFWLVNILQFFFGGLLSTYLVYYFRSGTLAVSWPFLLILAAAFIANESLKRRYTRLSFQISLFYLSLFSFAIFLVPIVLHSIGVGIFLLSGLVSLACLAIFLSILKRVARKRFSEVSRLLGFLISGIFITLNAMYFLKIIPPIPLSIKDADVYHSLVANGPGNYTVTHESVGLFDFFKLYEDVHIVDGNPLYAYSAVFSPTFLNTQIVHEWQWYDTQANTWITKSRVPLSVIGGKDGGYRTFSMKSGLLPGTWRVNIETERGEVIGRLRFNVIETNTTPVLQTSLIY